MKQNLITEVVQGMLPYLNNAQAEKLQEVLDDALIGYEVTLYLETDRQGASDLNRILPYYGVGKPGKTNLFDYSR